MRPRSTQLLPRLSLGALAVSASLNAFAGEFNESDGVAIQGFDAVAYVVDHAATQGVADYTSTYKGSVFRFKSAANRDAFNADPQKYAPQYNGYCAYGVSRGYKAGTSPNAFSVVDGKLYLNFNEEVKTMWAKDAPGYIVKADTQWASVEQTTKVIR